LLRATGLDTVFPIASGTLSPQNALAMSSQTKPTSSKSSKYDLKTVSMLNQIVSLALQLRQDVELPNHKYMAHQVALLYVRGIFVNVIDPKRPSMGKILQ
jgi:hypothetical protein